MKISMSPQPVGLLKLVLNLFAQILFKGENSADMLFMKYVLNFVMSQDTCELIVSHLV